MKRIIQALFLVVAFTVIAWAQYDTAYVPVRMTNTAAKVKIVPIGDADGFFGDSADVIVRTNNRRMDTLKLLAPVDYFASVTHGAQRTANVPATVSHNRGSVSLDLHPQTFSSAQVSLFSVSGKRVMRGRAAASKSGGVNISRRNIARGVYMLQVSGIKDTFTHRFVHDGGKLDIKVAFGGAGRLTKQTDAQGFAEIVWKLTASADGYADTSYNITPQKGNNPAQSITLRQKNDDDDDDDDKKDDNGKSALQYFRDENIKMGWNLGDALDAVYGYNSGNNVPMKDWIADETAWRNPLATEKLFEELAKRGFDIVRIPCSYVGLIGDKASGYKISEARLARVKQVVDWALSASLKVIIDIHHDGTLLDHPNTWGFLKFMEVLNGTADNAQVKEQLAAVWTQIATLFIDYDERLIFETLNEVHTGDWGRSNNAREQDTLYVWNQVALNAIRATGGRNLTRYVAIQGLGDASASRVTSAYGRTPQKLLPRDTVGGVDRGTSKLIVTVHYYDPWAYTIGGYENNISDGDFNRIDTDAQNLNATFIAKGIAVVYSEWGAQTEPSVRTTNNTIRANHIKYIRSVATAAIQNDIVPIMWDDGAEFKVIERNGTYIGNAIPGSLAEDVLRAYQDAVTNRP